MKFREQLKVMQEKWKLPETKEQFKSNVNNYIQELCPANEGKNLSI